MLDVWFFSKPFHLFVIELKYESYKDPCNVMSREDVNLQEFYHRKFGGGSKGLGFDIFGDVINHYYDLSDFPYAGREGYNQVNDPLGEQPSTHHRGQLCWCSFDLLR